MDSYDIILETKKKHTQVSFSFLILLREQRKIKNKNKTQYVLFLKNNLKRLKQKKIP
jgi:hypothetical protein